MNLNAVYVESIVVFHSLRDKTKESLNKLQDVRIPDQFQSIQNRAQRTLDMIRGKLIEDTTTDVDRNIDESYSHIFRRKTRCELVRISGAVCGIEFCYAAETAFVTPTLLSLGVNVKFMTMIWCLSPLIGFFLTPMLGSWSDSCRSRYGRRRPFILILSVGILIGLILIPNGNFIGTALGDKTVENEIHTFLNNETNRFQNINSEYPAAETSTDSQNQKEFLYKQPRRLFESKYEHIKSQLVISDALKNKKLYSSPYEIIIKKDANVSSKTLPTRMKSLPSTKYEYFQKNTTRNQPWSIFFTVLGTVLLDFCSDACQSPSRTYLLDVTIPEDHATGLTTFTVMAGVGGSVGYFMGGIDWEATSFGSKLGGHVRAVFLIVTIFFIIFMILTITSFSEIPLDLLRKAQSFDRHKQQTQTGKYVQFENETDEQVLQSGSTLSDYGSFNKSENLNNEHKEKNESCFNEESDSVIETNAELSSTIPDISASLVNPTFTQYIKSILHMPKSLKILCITNLFCWMSLVSYSLYFTDFVGEVVFKGDPREPDGSTKHKLFEDGVRFGCWGMSLYSISCSAYSFIIESLVRKFGAKPVYVGGQLIYAVGMILLAMFPHPVAVILLSPTAGIMYATLFTMPYILIAHYHCMQTFETESTNRNLSVRGIGTDVAVVGSMVFLAQFLLSLTMGSIVSAVNSSVATVWSAAILSTCGALCATKVFYLDL